MAKKKRTRLTATQQNLPEGGAGPVRTHFDITLAPAGEHGNFGDAMVLKFLKREDKSFVGFKPRHGRVNNFRSAVGIFIRRDRRHKLHPSDRNLKILAAPTAQPIVTGSDGQSFKPIEKCL